MLRGDAKQPAAPFELRRVRAGLTIACPRDDGVARAPLVCITRRERAGCELNAPAAVNGYGGHGRRRVSRRQPDDLVESSRAS